MELSISFVFFSYFSLLPCICLAAFPLRFFLLSRLGSLVKHSIISNHFDQNVYSLVCRGPENSNELYLLKKWLNSILIFSAVSLYSRRSGSLSLSYIFHSNYPVSGPFGHAAPSISCSHRDWPSRKFVGNLLSQVPRFMCRSNKSISRRWDFSPVLLRRIGYSNRVWSVCRVI